MTFDKWCKSQEINNADLAVKLQISENYVSMLRGGRRPSLELAKKIAVTSVGAVQLADWFRGM